MSVDDSYKVLYSYAGALEEVESLERLCMATSSNDRISSHESVRHNVSC